MGVSEKALQSTTETRWEVAAVDGYGKERSGPVLLWACSADGAAVAGREYLKLLGERRVRHVRVRAYDPRRDPRLGSYFGTIPMGTGGLDV